MVRLGNKRWRGRLSDVKIKWQYRSIFLGTDRLRHIKYTPILSNHFGKINGIGVCSRCKHTTHYVNRRDNILIVFILVILVEDTDAGRLLVWRSYVTHHLKLTVPCTQQSIYNKKDEKNNI